MTSAKQITANRLNALKSTGPRTAEGKQRSRQNAFRHGLAAETVIAAFESAADYRALENSLVADHQPASSIEHYLVCRLASVLWRLRRSTTIESGLFQMEGQLMQQRNMDARRRTIPPPEWHDDLDARSAGDTSPTQDSDRPSRDLADSCSLMPECFLQVSRLGYGAFHLLSRYENSLWRQAAQLLLILGSPLRSSRKSAEVRASRSQVPHHSGERPIVRLLRQPKRSP
jgi:hypothetical protein